MSTNPMSTALPWNLVAQGFAAEANTLFAAFGARALELAAPAADARLLDVACGAGSLCHQAAGRVARIDAVDFSSAMLEELSTRLEAAGCTNVFPLEADGQALPFDDNTFDAGFSMFGLIFFPDRVQGLKELNRVLKPSAPFVISSWVPAADSEVMQVFGDAITEALDATPPVDLAPMSTRALIDADFAAAGLTVERVERFSTSLTADSPEVFWESALRTNAPLKLMERNFGDAWPDVAERIRSALLSRLNEGAVSLEMPAWLTLARAT